MEKELPMLFANDGKESQKAKRILEQAGIETKIIPYECSDEGCPPIIIHGGLRFDGIKLIREYIQIYPTFNEYLARL